MRRRSQFAFLLLLLGMTPACATSESTLPTVQVVTVVTSPTVGPTQTPMLVTEVQTVVVTATPTATSTAARITPTAEEEVPHSTPTATPQPAPTSTPREAQPLVYSAPRLLGPSDGVSFTDAPPVLQWEPVSLRQDEYFEITIERFWQEQPYYSGSDWVQEPQFAVPSFVRGTSDTNQYTWWVTIKRLTGTNAAGGKVGEAISPPSEQRTFTWVTE